MIPLQLTLKNFLSYRKATLDFSGLHTACICGSNGAGKSSLLEAITWALWGESRVSTEDDVIHAGADEVQVDFTFKNQDVTYRVIRVRRRGGGGVLEFQVQTPTGFRALTERGMRSTQQLIVDYLKLDYETFINSAYLRQGRADEFMLKKPSERKEILAELLKLNQYEVMAEQAKDLSKQFKGQAEQLERDMESHQIQLQQREAIAQAQATLESELRLLQQGQLEETKRLQQLQAMQHQRRTWEQQLTWHRQQYQNLTQDCDRLQQDLAAIQQQQRQLEALLQQEGEISAGYSHFQQLQAQEESLNHKFEAHQAAQEQRRQLERQQQIAIDALNKQLQQAQAQLEALGQQEQEIKQILNQSAEVEAGLAQLQQARIHLTHMDKLQLQVSPLLQRQQQLQNQLERAQARLSARLDELRSSVSQLQAQHQRQPQLQQAVMDVGFQIENLEKKRVRQQRVQEKGLERRSFVERLQENQREYEKQLGELTQKLQMLQTPDAICPLCDRPLDQHHWNRVVQKTQIEQKDIEQQFWIVREQLAACESELQVLRAEYKKLSQELAPYDSLREQRGQLQAQLAATDDAQNRLQQLKVEAVQIERSIQTGDYAGDVQQELWQLEQNLQQLNYDEKNHALARNEVERWRWAEIRQAQIKDAVRRQAQIAARQPELLVQIMGIQRQIEQSQTDSEFSRRIAALDLQIQEIDYNLDRHNTIRKSLRQAQSWQLRYQELCQAQQQYPQLCQRFQELVQVLEVREGDREDQYAQIESVVKQIQTIPDATEEIQTLERQIFDRRTQLDEYLARLGGLQQRSIQLEALQAQYDKQQQKLAETRKKYRVYEELSKAFGKHGIQTYMIENILPQLEAETNSILARLSGNQLHVQFVTQKAGRSGRSSAKKTAKIIDTLDILIADARGTRPYETYSGGEAFRINFAIRLALARLLAQRAGTALQMLIVDEGFGTQDREGCDRLIAAINAIASDFACILTVTHMPSFKEAFQARIEVAKTQDGSQLSLSI
ncbi:exonuclease subunit SbcC [Planktothrix sp. FACHB-1355]|uniref:Nuclease SbcCD subunit C n=1 Tax=Aerosakkonema funiforme FACHB-1375 TaxID=2949571 RepID=A0A926VEK1_9CYAN|nr:MULTISPECIES: exonuclease subunit SbcC [Oscillatoriales]MBD2182252.1 exonuclease subunit SbcC [Aerosakkonema funiforme FACHB-1375]MBD3559395.1 exonuclease subunit SbcC [Planktothrix sp. FACHB-1355]